MAFVPNYEHDIFISYAHVDDEPLPGAKEGWVTTLIKALNTRLAQTLGRRDAYSLWIDHKLSRHVRLTPQIMDTLQKTAILIVILSPGYLASDWCQREKDIFFNFINKRDRSDSRIFIVERDKVEHNERPSEFDELTGYQFWEQNREGRAPRILGMPRPNPDDLRYYELLTDLSYDIKSELENLKAAPNRSGAGGPPVGDGPAVFLAEVTDDLDPLRDNVKRYLAQAGVRVLPGTWYSREPGAFQQAVERDLSNCKLFTQLLSGAAGKKSPDLPQGYGRLQFECAQEAGKPILQWRSRQLDLDIISDADHRTFLELATVRAVGIEEFKRAVVEQAFYQPPAPIQKRVNAFIFVDTETRDRSIANSICSIFEGYGADIAMPLDDGKPADVRKELEQNIIDCDGMVIIYGEATAAWVRGQLRQCRKMLIKREHPLKALAIFEGPPEQKVPLDLRLQKMQVLNCRKGINEAELKSFIDCLQAE